MPRWRSLSDDEVHTKTADWDLVTDADVECERLLTGTLRELIDIPVVGEEATASNPALPDIIGTGAPCWVVDPVDGTRNFVRGTQDFACMVALIEGGVTRGAWITYPAVGREMHALLGGGAVVDGAPHTVPAAPAPGALIGAISARFAGRDTESVTEEVAQLGPARPIRFCAGWDYLDVVEGRTHYVSFTRSLPWDHAPGTLIAQEAGLRIGRFDGAEYLPGDDRDGVLTAPPAHFDAVAQTLRPWVLPRA